MTKTAVSEQITHRWYTRPVLFVADVNRALRFYIGMLGFEKSWHEGDGAGGVCQVHRAGCEIILCEDATRSDKARLFVALNVDGLTAFRREIVERSVPTEKSWWGYDVIKIVDPDGNELLFPAGRVVQAVACRATAPGDTREVSPTLKVSNHHGQTASTLCRGRASARLLVSSLATRHSPLLYGAGSPGDGAAGHTRSFPYSESLQSSRPNGIHTL